MKIAIDARMIKMSGIGNYIQHLLKYNDYDVVLGKKQEIKEYSNCNNIIEYQENIYGIKEQLKFPYKKIKKLKPDILHVPHYNVPIFYRGKMIVTIHDLTHLIYPEFLPNRIAYIYAKVMLWIATRKALEILTVSENTKRDIIKYLKVKPEKIKVIYNGVGEEFVKKKKDDIKYLYKRFDIPENKKLLMYVGNLKPHKNLERLLEAYSYIKNRDDTCLILVGKSFSKYNVLSKKEKELNIEKNIIYTGVVEQQELVDLYNLVDIFIFPSLYEGFGIPVIESLACGTPVIASNTSSIPEVGGDDVIYIDPLDIKDITNKIDLVLKNKGEKKDFTKRVKMFSWRKTSKETKNEYIKMIDT